MVGGHPASGTFTAKGAVDREFETILNYNLVTTGPMALQANYTIVISASVGTQASLLRLKRDGDHDGSFGVKGVWSDTAVRHPQHRRRCPGGGADRWSGARPDQEIAAPDRLGCTIRGVVTIRGNSVV